MEIDEIPLFNQESKWDDSFQLRLLYNKNHTCGWGHHRSPGHNHTITAECLGTVVLPCTVWKQTSYDRRKPTMIKDFTCSKFLRRSWTHQGLTYTLPGNEFLWVKAKEAFDLNGNITNEGTVKFLGTCLDNFRYVWRLFLNWRNQNQSNLKT